MTTAPQDSDYRTAAELAAHFRTSKPTIRLWARTGVLPPPFLRTTRHTLWRWSEVIAHLERRQTEQTQQTQGVARG